MFTKNKKGQDEDNTTTDREEEEPSFHLSADYLE